MSIAAGPRTSALFDALADPTRRRILDLLRRHQPLRAGEIAARFPSRSRPGISRHLRVLRRAAMVRLVASSDRRERRYEINPAPLQDLDGWLDRYRSFWEGKLDALEQAAAAGEPDQGGQKSK